MTTTKDALPLLPQSLIDLIGEYSLARTDGVGEIQRLHLWGLLISGIKEYALAALASKQAPPDLREIECPPDPDVVDRSLSERPRLSPYDAVARAMDLASLLAGSVGMNNKEQANAYSSRLRRHLIEYVYPATAAEAQAKSEPAALTDERIIELAGLSSNRRVCASNCGAQPCKCYPGMTAAEAISLVRAAIAATQGGVNGNA